MRFITSSPLPFHGLVSNVASPTFHLPSLPKHLSSELPYHPPCLTSHTLPPPPVRKTLGHAPFASSSTDTRPLRHSSIASFVSEISILSHPVLNRPQPVTRTQSLRVLVINFQSAKPKKVDFWRNSDLFDPDIILGTETWLNHPSITNNGFFPPTFDIYRRERPNRGCGTLVATKKSLITHQNPANPSSETVIVSVQTNNRSSNLIVGSLYRAPFARSGQETAALLDAFDRACRWKKDVVWLGGDLHFPDIDRDTNSIVRRQHSISLNEAQVDRFQDCGMLQTNRNP